MQRLDRTGDKARREGSVEVRFEQTLNIDRQQYVDI